MSNIQRSILNVQVRNEERLISSQLGMGDGFARKKKEPPMDADERRQKIDKLTERIIGCAFTVGNVLGCGFLEKVYENALAHELRRNGLRVQQQHGISVCYDDVVVGEYVADLLVDDEVLVELKAVQSFDEIHTAQSLNYLNATGLHICLLVNFGKPKVEIRRLVRDF